MTTVTQYKISKNLGGKYGMECLDIQVSYPHINRIQREPEKKQ